MCSRSASAMPGTGSSSGATPSREIRVTSRYTSAPRAGWRHGRSPAGPAGSVDATLERDRPLHGLRAAGARASRAPRTPCGRRGAPPTDRSTPAARAPATPCSRIQRRSALTRLADVARRRAHADRLDMPARLVQPAVLVEVAAHEAGERVVVGVQDRRARVERAAPAMRAHGARERLVLGVRHVREADLLPARTPVARVDVRQEDRVRRHPGRARRRWARSRRRTRSARARSSARCPAAAGAGRTPRRRRRRARTPRGRRASQPGTGVASWVRKQISSPLRALGAEVARAPVPELVAGDREHLGAGRARDLRRAVARAGVDHEHLQLRRPARATRRASPRGSAPRSGRG